MRLTVRDAATLLHVPERLILRGIRDGSLPAHNARERWMLSRDELLEWAGARGIDLGSDALLAWGDSPADSLAEALAAGGIHHDLPGQDLPGVLGEVVARLPLPAEGERAFLLEALLARETFGSTAIGGGVAVPHVRRPIVLDVAAPTVTLAFLRCPLDLASPDGLGVRTLFVIVSPTVRTHLHLLARLAFALRDGGVRALVDAAGPGVEIIEAVRRLERSAPPRGAGIEARP